ncbi:MAG TPA: hypothetical protein VHY22_03910 [Chthoniobacteraceae bacterium]|nr:hypothetical protein [Chthoniobacteraceae bacterium]
MNPWTYAILLSCLIVAVDLYFSWRGSGAPNLPGCFNVNLGYQRDAPITETRALSRMADAVQRHPGDRYFEVRWTNSLFFGWDTDSQWWLNYDRQNKQMLEGDGINLGNDPDQAWDGVSEDMLPDIARHGFDNGYLQKIGCHSRLD